MTALLGIETSCDETAAAVVVDGCQVRSNVVASQIDLHQKYGGVVPEIASRAHIEWLDGTLAEALEQAGMTHDAIDAIAVSNRPGLVGSLLIGVTAAKTLAWSCLSNSIGRSRSWAATLTRSSGLDSDLRRLSQAIDRRCVVSALVGTEASVGGGRGNLLGLV